MAALVAVLPLIVHGCSCGHDFDFHLLNWIEAATQFAHGNLHPHWAYTPAYNAGEPRFVFYPPISWILGALLGLLLTHLPGVSEAAAQTWGWTAAPILYTWIALTLSGLTLYRLARAFATPNAALLAAVLYLANPYMLFTAYERTAYAELLAAAWLPLLLLAILRPGSGDRRVTIAGIALPLALLWLTNAPAAVIGTYTLALLAALRILAATNPGAPRLEPETWVSRHKTTLQLALNILAGTALGLALPAFYLLPAAYERRYVQIAMATIAGMRIDRNFLFEHTGTTSDAVLHDQVLHTASLIAVILLFATALALAAVFARRKLSPTQGAFPLLPLTVLAIAIAFLLTPWSAPVWAHVPQASFLQFPWRLLYVLAAVLALTFARAISNAPGAPSIAARWVGREQLTVPILTTLTLAAALAFPAYHVFRQRCFSEDTAPARLALFHSNAGTDPTDEYTPLHADNDALTPLDPSHPPAPPYWLAATPGAPAPNSGAPGLASQTWAGARPQPGPTPAHFTLTAPHPEYLILNLRDYPAWRITLNGAPAAQRLHRPDGLIALPIPAGASTLAIAYARTPDQTLGDAITLLALPLLLVTLRPKRPH